MTTSLALARDVQLASSEHGAILLDSRNGQMYGLNPSAAVFCRALTDGLGREGATAAVLEAFEAPQDAIRTDLDTLVTHLVELNLVAQQP